MGDIITLDGMLYAPNEGELGRLPKPTGKKPILYQDVDGCLFGGYGEPRQFQLRPGVNSYLQWVCTNFEVRWLTCWTYQEIMTLMHLLYVTPQRLGAPVPAYQYWSEWKHDGIDWDADFYWVDDAPEFGDMGLLKERGKLDRFILCDSQGADGLVEVQKKLEAILEARQSAA